VAALTRRDLKTDRFAQEVGHTVEYVGQHRAQIVRYSVIALVLAVVIAGIYFYRQRQHTQRQQELANAIRVQEAPIGGGSPGTPLSFPTQQAKDEAALKAFGDLASTHPGTEEADIATYFRGAILADQGKLQEAEKLFQQVAENANRDNASLARLSLSQLYFATNRAQEGERILRDLMEKPTNYVSKEQAAFSLARGLARTNPVEARKLLDPLRTSRSAVSQAAIQLYAELTP
jgi:tetratricopeptide (TPR) repeat protein